MNFFLFLFVFSSESIILTPKGISVQSPITTVKSKVLKINENENENFFILGCIFERKKTKKIET